MKNFLARGCLFLFIFLIWFIFASPYFLKGKIPYSSTYQSNFFPPWSAYHTYDGPVKNSAMPDVIDQIYPWKHLTVESWKQGFIPFWNPYSFSGTVHLANYQSAVFSPFNLLFFIFPFIDAWSLLILLQPLLAGIFMYMFVRSLEINSISYSGKLSIAGSQDPGQAGMTDWRGMDKNIGIIGSLISATGFMFCGFITVWMDYGTLGYAILFLPLALFAIEKFYKTTNHWYLVLLSFTVPLSFFSGHFQISLYFLGVVMAYIVYKAKQKKLLTTIFLMLYILFGLLLAMPQILPSLEIYTQSLRSSMFHSEEVIPWNYLPTFIAPDFFGHPVTRNDWFGHYAEWNAYIGLVPFILAWYCLIRRRDKQTLFFFFIAMISILLAFPSPVLSWLVSLHIPVLATSAASRIIVLFSFAMLVLASFGFNQLLMDIGEKKFKYIYLTFTLFSLLFALLWISVFGKLFLSVDKITIAKQNLVFPTIIFLFSIVSFIILTRVQIIVKLLNRSVAKSNSVTTLPVGRQAKQWNNTRIKRINLVTAFVYYLLLLIIVIDMERFATKWQTFDPKKFVFPDTPVIKFLQKTVRPDERVIGNFGAQVCVYYHISCVDGYDTLYVKRYGEFVAYVDKGHIGESFRSVVAFPKNGKYTPKAINLLGVKYIIHKVSDGYVAWTFPFWKYPKDQFQLVYEDHAYQVYKNTKAFPQAFFANSFIIKTQSENILSMMFNQAFDIRHKIVLEEDPKISPSNSIGAVSIKHYSPNNIIMMTDTSSSKLLLFSNNDSLGWQAFIDGRKTHIFRADYTLRSIIVPAGTHVISFIYRPISFTIGIFSAWCGIGGIIVLWILSKRLFPFFLFEKISK